MSWEILFLAIRHQSKNTLPGAFRDDKVAEENILKLIQGTQPLSNATPF